ncbi:MAG: type II CAAX endopeptidase family protein [Pseudomonadota bacterium]
MSLFPVEGLDPGTWTYSVSFLTWFTLGMFQVLSVLLLLAFVLSQFSGQVIFTLALQPPYASLRQIVSTVVLVMAVLAGLSWISFNFFWSEVQQDLGLFKRLLESGDLLLPVLVLCIGAPLSEELLFRGYLFGRLSQSWLGPLGATLLTTLGWTLLHGGYSIIGLIQVFVAGLLFTWALWRTGSLWVPLCMHAIYNAVVLSIIKSLPLGVTA